MTNTENLKKKVTFICTGNTCRSPMARVLLEARLKDAGVADNFNVESAAFGNVSEGRANRKAREAIKTLLGEDLLASHIPKRITADLVAQSDLILVMEAGMKVDLPTAKTWTLKEYAGGSGNVADPISGDSDVYIGCASEISAAIKKIMPKLVSDQVSLNQG